MLSAWRGHHIPQLGAQSLGAGPLHSPPHFLTPVTGLQRHLCSPHPQLEITGPYSPLLSSPALLEQLTEGRDF